MVIFDFLLAPITLTIYTTVTILLYSNISTVKKKLLSVGQLGAVARLFGVLSEPSRLLLLQALHDCPLSVNELVEACSMKQANVSKHLAVLHAHHLVQRERQGNSILYAIADPMIFSLCSLVCGKMEKDAKRAVALFQP
jgi:DNA-binding transcriptional ArsR family regulator